MNKTGGFAALFKEAYVEWHKDYASLLAGALAFFTIFSIIPVLIIATAVIGTVLGPEAADAEILRQLKLFLSPDAISALNALFATAQKSGAGIASFISGVLLLAVASHVFVKVQHALNIIWRAEDAKKNVLKQAIRTRFVSFAAILVLGVFAFSFYVLESTHRVVLVSLKPYVPGIQDYLGWDFLSPFVSFLLSAFLFCSVFKFLPQTKVAWRDVWLGGIVTTLLLGLLRHLSILYFQLGDLTSVYGLAGSVLVILIWVYLSAQVFLFGAELTFVYAHRLGSRA